MLGATASPPPIHLERPWTYAAVPLWASLAGLLVACGGMANPGSQVADSGVSAAMETAGFLPLHKGSYWLYEVRDSGVKRTGLKQVLVSDEALSANGAKGVEFVMSIRDMTVPPKERPDEPTIIRRNIDGSLECLDCGGVFMPAQIADGATWQTASPDASCSLAHAPFTYSADDGRVTPAILVECNSTLESSTHVYAEDVGLILAIVRERRENNWVERVERLKEYRTLVPAKLPPLGSLPK